jgi:hypothetical protein
MKLRIDCVSSGERPWSVIDGHGRFGDQILASNLSEEDAATCMFALFMARRTVEGRRV